MALLDASAFWQAGKVYQGVKTFHYQQHTEEAGSSTNLWHALVNILHKDEISFSRLWFKICNDKMCKQKGWGRFASPSKYSHLINQSLDICPQYPRWRASSISRSRNWYGLCYVLPLRRSRHEFTQYYKHRGCLNIHTNAEGSTFLILVQFDDWPAFIESLSPFLLIYCPSQLQIWLSWRKRG